MSYWNQQIQLLKNRSFQFYLYSCIAGTFASGLAYIVTIWMIVSFHASINATLVGMILFWMPSLVLSPHFGAMVDRYDRKKLIIIAESIRAMMFAVFGVILFYQPALSIIYLLLALSGCFAALYKPLLPAFVHELVPANQLLYANANINMAYEFGNIIGRGIITIAVLSFVGAYGALFMVALLYVVSAVTMIPVHRHHALKNAMELKNPNFIKSISNGYCYLFSKKELLLYALIQAIILMSLMAAPVLVAPYVKIVLQANNKIFGFSEAAISTGTIAGAFFWSYLANYFSKEFCLAIASILAGLSYLILANTAGINYALCAFLALGFSLGTFALIMSIVQSLTDKNFQGRVQAAISAAVTTIFICFSIFLYSFDKIYSTQHAFIILMFLCPLVFVGIIIAQRFKRI